MLLRDTVAKLAASSLFKTRTIWGFVPEALKPLALRKSQFRSVNHRICNPNSILGSRLFIVVTVRRTYDRASELQIPKSINYLLNKRGNLILLPGSFLPPIGGETFGMLKTQTTSELLNRKQQSFCGDL